MNTRALITAATIFVSQPSAFVLAQASSAYIESGGGTAVDTRGQRYFGKDYPEKLMHWMVDRVYSISPDYPYGDRAQRHEGTGYFRLSLAPKTGTVTQVRVVRSTGFASLDACATTALRWLAAILVPFALSYACYWLPVWLGGSEDQHSAWEFLVVGVWFAAGVVASVVVTFIVRRHATRTI